MVRIEGMNGGFIRAEDERRLLQDGMTRFNLSLDEANGAMLATVNDQKLVLQRVADEGTREFLNVQASRSRQRTLSRHDFRQAVEMYRAKARQRVSEEEAKRRVKSLMLEEGITAKRHGWIIRSRRWFNSIPEQIA
jgi:dynactin complex subunit